MNLKMPVPPERYKSASQKARRATEAWAATSLYCAACDSNSLLPFPNNQKAVDLRCAGCESTFQLKSSKTAFGRRVADGAYKVMLAAVMSDAVPDLLLLKYDPHEWVVQNLLLVPHFFFVPSVIEERVPLRETAQRAGWHGCAIRLDRIPPDGRIPLITKGEVLSESAVRQRYRRIEQLGTGDAESRGWRMDVLAAVRRLGKDRFTLREFYQFVPELSALHPANNTVEDKIRQQLQELRDLGILRFHGRGHYEVLQPSA